MVGQEMVRVRVELASYLVVPSAPFSPLHHHPHTTNFNFHRSQVLTALKFYNIYTWRERERKREERGEGRAGYELIKEKQMCEE